MDTRDLFEVSGQLEEQGLGIGHPLYMEKPGSWEEFSRILLDCMEATARDKEPERRIAVIALARVMINVWAKQDDKVRRVFREGSAVRRRVVASE